MRFKPGTIVKQQCSSVMEFFLILEDLDKESCLVCKIRKFDKPIPKSNPLMKKRLTNGRNVLINHTYFFVAKKESLYLSEYSFDSPNSVRNEVVREHNKHFGSFRPLSKRNQKKQKEMKRNCSLTAQYEIASINNDRETMKYFGCSPARSGLPKGKSGCSNGTFQSYLKPFYGGRYTPK